MMACYQSRHYLPKPLVCVVQGYVVVQIRRTQCCFSGPKLVRPFLQRSQLPLVSWADEWNYHQVVFPTILDIFSPFSAVLHSN